MANSVRTVYDFEVFQRAFELSLRIHKVSLEFPKIEQFALADQLRRSTKSICANLAEGFGKQRLSKTEFRRFIIVALGSSDESQVWIKYAIALGYVSKGMGEEMLEGYRIISRQLQALYTSTKNLQSDNR